TLRSLALFAHVFGMLMLYITLAVEWMSVELLRRTDRPPSFATDALRLLPRFTAAAVVLILASGLRLAAQVGALRSAWVDVSFAVMGLTGALGGAALRPLIRSLRSNGDASGTLRRQASTRFVRVSLHMRVAAALGIVYLMIAKPDLLESAAIVTIALAIGAAE